MKLLRRLSTAVLYCRLFARHESTLEFCDVVEIRDRTRLHSEARRIEAALWRETFGG